jgi:hypothetical protein
MRVHSGASASIPAEGQPTNNACLLAELQALTLTIHMFGLDGLANMTAERAYETPKNEQVGVANGRR